MRILLTNNHLQRMGGSETWIFTMAKELKRQGYDVGVFTHAKGYVSDLLGDLIDDKPKDYDLALINHNSCIGVDAKFKIFTSHGYVPQLEKPVPGADVYVAVNEIVADYHNLTHIIKNPIDAERFKPTSEINTFPEKILAITDVPVNIPGVFYPSRYENNMPELINQADVVITLGRGVLEAMSCGRNVIVWDKRPYWEARGDGYLTLPLKGFTGGGYVKNDIDLEFELKKYNKYDGERNREYILKNHDVKLIVDKYMSLYKENMV